MSTRKIKGPFTHGEEYSVFRVITNDEMKALKATPLVVLQAPGAGWAYQVERIYATCSAGTAWTETADNILIEYTGGTDILTIETTGFIDQATAQVRTQAVVATVLTPVANEGIQITNADDEIGGGTATKTCTIQIIYRVVKAA